MTQAARLTLRMQKELKLLLSDPPPGATFPNLSSDSDHIASSVTAIDAQIEGPKGTVYENGFFHVKIQIPERYPFQPPIVTFVTQIYHPNIDTGGRICLDILNLPPKGAWQPSLNISTVTTSIGLLLSAPNPDDGLMCEASREYKYNRQVFDQKAISMTEKYAKALSGRSSSSNEGLLINSNSSQGEKMAFLDEGSSELNDSKQDGISRKLPLQSSGSTETSIGKRLADQADSAPLKSQLEIQHKMDSNYDPSYININDGKPSGIRQVLSLKASCQSRKIGSDEKNTTSQIHNSGSPIPQTSQPMKRFTDGDFLGQDVGLHSGKKPRTCKQFPADLTNKMQGDHVDFSKKQQVTQPTSTGFCPDVPKVSSFENREVDCSGSKPTVEDKNLVAKKETISSYKHWLSNKKHNLGPQELTKKAGEGNKENTPQFAHNHVSGRLVKSKLNLSIQEPGFHRRLSLQPLKTSQANHEPPNEINTSDKTINQVKEEPEHLISKELIIMDSEDEEETEEPASSKPKLGRRRLCLAWKRKAKA